MVCIPSVQYFLAIFIIVGMAVVCYLARKALDEAFPFTANMK
jgi:hypothetical protein